MAGYRKDRGRKKPERRECLKCRRPFLSRGNDNRLCGKCNEENEREFMPSVYHEPRDK